MNRRFDERLFAAVAFAALASSATTLGACGAGDDDSTQAESGLPGSGGSGGSNGNSAGRGGSGALPGTGGSGAASPSGGTGGLPPEPPPPEAELESAFEVPVATDRYVWSANPASGRVALINAETYEVRLAEVGIGPTTVAAVPAEADEDAALVLNEGSSDVTLLRVGEDGSVETRTARTHVGATSISVAPSGRWAIAWTNAATFPEDSLDPTDGLQDVTVLALGDGGELDSTVLNVGYRPSRVSFDAAEERAYVVTEPGLSVIAIGGEPRVERLVELTDTPVSDQAARDVSITPDGALALVRVDGSTALGVVDLDDGTRRSIELGAFVTDLDLASDGREAFAVAGDELVVVPVPPATDDASSFRRASVAGAIVRSVSLSPGADLALLYANAEDSPYVTLFATDDDWETFAGRSVDLKAPVQAAFASPDGTHGIALQVTVPGSRKTGAFSILSAEPNRAPKIIGTDAPPFQVAFTPDGKDAVVATRDLTAAKYGVYLIHLENMADDFTALPSPPLAAGMVPMAGRAFVAQAHPEGRISFVDLKSGALRTLTGFELAAKVVE